MGLYIEPGGAQWSYSGFNDFRRRLAKRIGIVLDFMPMFDFKVSDKIKPEHAHLIKGLEWPDDPIVYLLAHSDCEGIICPHDCKKCWPRLQQLIKPWEDSDYDKQMATRLIDGMRLCVVNGQDLKFT